jgi:hypothetical protein
MKGFKVVDIECHIGVHKFAGKQSLSMAKMKDASAEMNAIGVTVRATQGEHKKIVFIPYSNIQHIELTEEEAPKAKKE